MDSQHIYLPLSLISIKETCRLIPSTATGRYFLLNSTQYTSLFYHVSLWVYIIHCSWYCCVHGSAYQTKFICTFYCKHMNLKCTLINLLTYKQMPDRVTVTKYLCARWLAQWCCQVFSSDCKWKNVSQTVRLFNGFDHVEEHRRLQEKIEKLQSESHT